MQSIARTTFSRATLARNLARHAPRALVHTVPELPYAYNALEPHISKQIMELHHQKHHKTYVDGLNKAEETFAQATTTQQKIAVQSALKFHGGGHINHTFFWKILAPTSEGGGQLNDGPLKTALVEQFKTVEDFKKEFNATTAAIQGSGWGWLAYNKQIKKLEIITTANQDTPLSPYVPIIGVDIWEHAFYLQYKNVKPDYLNAIWNVINFKQAESLYAEATK